MKTPVPTHPALFAGLFLLASAASSLAVEAPTVSWGRQAGSAADESGKALAVDHNGRCYIAGLTSGDLAAPSAGKRDAFVAAYDADGKQRWLRQMGTPGDDAAWAIALAPDGALDVAGSAEGKLGDQHFGAKDAFVARIDDSGRLVWLRQYGTNDNDSASAIACDSAGSIFVTGSTDGSLGEKSVGATDAFLMKLDNEGNLLWTAQWGTGEPDQGASVATDEAGNLYVAGTTKGAMPGCTNAGNSDIFVSKIDPSGHVAWNKQFGTSEPDAGMKVLVDSAMNIYVGGSSGGAFAGPQQGQGDSVLLKLAPTGELQWKRQFGTERWDGIHGIAFTGDRQERIAVGGCQNWNQCQAFVREFDQDGNEEWSTMVPADVSTCGTQIGIDDRGAIYQTGGTHGPTFGEYRGSDSDLFLVRLSREP